MAADQRGRGVSCPLGKRALLRTLVAETVTASFEPVAPNADVTPAGFSRARRRTRTTTSSCRALGAPWPRRGKVQDRATSSRASVAAATREGPRVTTKQSCERGQQPAGGVAGPCHVAAQHRQLVTEQGDFDILLVGRRPSRTRSSSRRTSKKVTGQPRRRSWHVRRTALRETESQACTFTIHLRRLWRLRPDREYRGQSRRRSRRHARR